MVIEVYFFKQKTAYEMRISDWSSDVCSSDLCSRSRFPAPRRRPGDQPDSWLSVLEGSWALTPVLAMQRKRGGFWDGTCTGGICRRRCAALRDRSAKAGGELSSCSLRLAEIGRAHV